MAINIEETRQKFDNKLLETKRPGIEKVLSGLDKLGFYKAPASSRFHLNEAGGLLLHSINVYVQAMMIRSVEIKIKPEIEAKVPVESVAIAALLHDVCKAEIYKIEKKNRKNAEGKWEQYDAYVQDYSHNPLGHGEKSVIRLLRMGLEMTDDEILAIRWHMAKWAMGEDRETLGNFGAACDKCPLLPIIIAADELATRISEVKAEDKQ